MKLRLLILGLVMIAYTSCTSDGDFEKGKQQLEQQGYTEVENTGYDMFCCDDNDDFSTGFKAKNSKGDIVTGCFCSAITKGVTIRFK